MAWPAIDLGSNNTHIVLESADVDPAIDAGIFGSFSHQGQMWIDKILKLMVPLTGPLVLSSLQFGNFRSQGFYNG